MDDKQLALQYAPIIHYDVDETIPLGNALRLLSQTHGEAGG